jgi:TP901 family phage tail tape measure protein
LQTLKEIDTALVDIAKVTGLSAEEMKELAFRASEVGVALGRTTQEYLKAVAEFSRAGYKEQAEGLAELSLLLQNTGDISSDVANGMLIAVDAAYDLGGSTEELTSVINSLNEISNKNPTSVAKMADGIKVAASVFSTAGVELNEFISLVGTATSATQLSGSQISRGLRSVLLNITGVTDAASDVTEESISKAEEVLGKYEIMARDSAESFRNPMEVLGDIANAFTTTLKDNEVAQMEIIGRLAGKYQANVLSSILDNWDMVKKQQLEAMYSMNSAMAENEIYMNSWEAKSAQLSSAVSAFWQKSINTDLVKDFIDGLRAIVETITEWGGAIPVLAGVITTVLIPAFSIMITKLAAINIGMGGIPIVIGLVVGGLTAYAMKTKEASDAMNEFKKLVH